MNTETDNLRFIHLLYVPTMACNLACRYCYLEDETKDLGGEHGSLETLQFAVEKFRRAGAVPFNISLHGGEVTTLPKQEFRELIAYISDYYESNRELITDHGFKVGRPHIKTNLYDLDKHLDTLRDYEVSISGSLDLPLDLHEKFRVTKGGKGSLARILSNIAMLKDLPGKRKVSATIFKEHYEHLPQIIQDIRFLQQETDLDMNDFNFMIGFDYNSGGLLTPLTQEEQVDFFEKMHAEFDGTDLDEGVCGAWFNEFGPEYCTNCDNCGDKFFLLEKNGDIYSCVRGQKHPEFYYGNIYKDSVEQIFEIAHTRILEAHHRNSFPEECGKCGWLYMCKTGCPFVKSVYRSGKSYTCALQKKLYERRGYEYKGDAETIYDYVTSCRPELIDRYLPIRADASPDGNPANVLTSIISSDPKLQYIYDDSCFVLRVAGQDYKLQSQILKQVRDVVCLAEGIEAKLYVRKDVLEQQSPYPQNNALYIQVLSGNLITYGDEGRTKQAHVCSHLIYRDVLEGMPSDRKGWYCVDILPIIRLYKHALSTESPNNIFFTTSDLRAVHYQKQKDNAYYHIQAINLPFQNIEFYFLGDEEL